MALKGADIQRAYASIAQSQAAFQSIGEGLRLAQIQSAQSVSEIGRSMSAFSDLAQALSVSMVANQKQWQSVIDNISASVRPLTPAIASIQATLDQFSAAFQSPGFIQSIAAAQRAISTPIPAEALRGLPALSRPISESTVRRSLQDDAPEQDGAPEQEKDEALLALRAREVEVEKQISVVLPSLVTVAENQPSGALTITEALQYSVVLYIAAGVTSLPLILAFASAIAAALIQLAFANRGEDAKTDRVVEAIEQLRKDINGISSDDDPDHHHPKS